MLPGHIDLLSTKVDHTNRHTFTGNSGEYVTAVFDGASFTLCCLAMPCLSECGFLNLWAEQSEHSYKSGLDLEDTYKLHDVMTL